MNKLLRDGEEVGPTPPVAPTNLKAELSNKNTHVILTWDYDEPHDHIEFQIYINDKKKIIVSDKTVAITDLFPDNAYSAKVVAIDKLTALESKATPLVPFYIKKPEGFDQQSYWIPSKIDNINVTYRK